MLCEVCFKRLADRDGACNVCHGVADDTRKRMADIKLPKIECNADLDHPCDADDGEPCPSCVVWAEQSAADARASYAVASPKERNPVQYAQDMRDAGRGHLLRDDE